MIKKFLTVCVTLLLRLQVIDYHSRFSHYAFYASSLLLFFDGSFLVTATDHSNVPQDFVGARVIDFGHVREDTDADKVGCLDGLLNLRSILVTLSEKTELI